MSASEKNIVLIGMPGAGKSTVGVLLAKALKRPFVDTDLEIQTRTNRFLQDIIDSDGIQAFLDIEARVIGDVQRRGHVVATGGSAVYREAAMAHLRAQGVIIYLAVTCPTLEKRLRSITTRGIAKHPAQSLRDLYEERRPLYEQYADVTLPTDTLTTEETVAQLIALLAR